MKDLSQLSDRILHWKSEGYEIDLKPLPWRQSLKKAKEKKQSEGNFTHVINLGLIDLHALKDLCWPQNQRDLALKTDYQEKPES